MHDHAKQPANTNACDFPILDLSHSGDPALLYRALARVLVRRELIFATSNSAQNDCDPVREVG
jgi:hypothetical protein